MKQPVRMPLNSVKMFSRRMSASERDPG